jgi:hypothetical protein
VPVEDAKTVPVADAIEDSAASDVKAAVRHVWFTHALETDGFAPLTAAHFFTQLQKPMTYAAKGKTLSRVGRLPHPQ